MNMTTTQTNNVSITDEQIEAVTRIFCAYPYNDDIRRAFRLAGVKYELASDVQLKSIYASAESDTRCPSCGRLTNGDYQNNACLDCLRKWKNSCHAHAPIEFMLSYMVDDED